MSELPEESQKISADLVVPPAPQEEPVPPEVPPVQLPGQTLREAREAMHVTVFEVAQSLKFSPRQIEALEADDYAALPPGATFLRGFVRGYAKLLKLDPAPLLGLLDVRAPAALPDVREPQNMGVAATPVAAGSRSSRPLLFGAAALALVVVGFGALHFLGSSPTADKPSTPVAAAETAAVRPPDIRIEDAPTPPAVPPGEVSASPNPDARQLVFLFKEKSWLEVRDATQRVIFSGENPAGTRQAVVGKPPFQLVIGNAANVELQYEDRQIDLKPHIRAEVARLTVE